MNPIHIYGCDLEKKFIIHQFNTGTDLHNIRTNYKNVILDVIEDKQAAVCIINTLYNFYFTNSISEIDMTALLLSAIRQIKGNRKITFKFLKNYLPENSTDF